MGRKKAPIPKPEGPMGPLIAANLMRLGFYQKTVTTADVARRITEKTGKTMSRQRVAAILKADRVEDETITMLAKAVGVKVAELMKPIEEPGF